MPFNYSAMQLRATAMIAHYGMPSAFRKSYLRRKISGVPTDRECQAAEIAFSPTERSKLADPTSRRYLIAALNTDGTVLDPEPDNQQDHLVLKDADGNDVEVLRIFERPGRLAPAGLPVFFDVMARG